MKNLKMVLNMRYIGLLLLATLIYSCEDRLNYDDSLPSSLNIVESIKIGNTEATIDNLSGVVNFVLPSDTNLSAVKLIMKSPQGVTLSPESGSTVNLTTPLELKATVNGKVRKYIINARVLPSQIAFVNDAASINDILDDDVKAAALWAQSIYGNKFVYIPFSDLTTEKLKSVNVVFFYYDTIGTSALPQGSIDKKSILIQYVVEGGKMLLGGMATSYAELLGRDKSGMLTIKDNGAGGNNPDIWTIDGGVNYVNDQRNHPIYNFSNVIPTDSHGFVRIIDGGFKENHNTLWDIAPLLGPGHQKGQFAEFERLYGGKVIGLWGGVTDECCPGIIEFKANSVYSGTIIAIGIGGMEWSMNDGRTNPYDGNVRGIYKNAINYLQTK